MHQAINKVSVVIPVLNERDSIVELHERLTRILTGLKIPYEIIVVDDGSSDETFDVVRSCSSVKAFRFSRNYGKTAALACGIENATGDVVITMDGDLENHPEDIPLFIEKAREGYGVVSGWRRKRWNRQRLTRRVPSEIANWLISKTTGVRLHDHGCMFKLFRRNTLNSMVFLGDMHRFIAAYAVINGAKISEFSHIQRNTRHSGVSFF
jgi:glycosyltransferase involved in cell wall biosynthesis